MTRRTARRRSGHERHERIETGFHAGRFRRRMYFDASGSAGLRSSLVRTTNFRHATGFERMTGGIFISYRRQDSKSDARSICQRLEKTFGRGRVFIDVDSIRPGEDFQSVLENDLDKCNIMIVVIGPRWLELLRSSGPTDSQTSQDYVSMEIASALKRKLPIFPVLVDGATMPDAKDLPDDLKQLSFRQALSIRHDSFPRDMSGLEQELRQSVPMRRTWKVPVLSGLAILSVVCDLLLCLVVFRDLLEGRKFRVLQRGGVSRQLARGSDGLRRLRMQFRKDVPGRMPHSRSQQAIENRHSRQHGHDPGRGMLAAEFLCRSTVTRRIHAVQDVTCGRAGRNSRTRRPVRCTTAAQACRSRR